MMAIHGNRGWRGVRGLLVCALLAVELATLSGCGGGGTLSQAEMKRRALRRRSSSEEQPDQPATANAAKPENQPAEPENKPTKDGSQTAAAAADGATSSAPSQGPSGAGGVKPSVATTGVAMPKGQDAAPNQSVAGDSDAEPAAVVAAIAAPTSQPTDRPALVLDVGASGGKVVFGDQQGQVGVFDVATAALERSFRIGQTPVTAVSYDDPRPRLAAATSQGEIRVLSAATAVGLDNFEKARLDRHANGPTLIGHAGDVTSLAFNQPGDRLASADVTGVIRVWKLLPSPPSMMDRHAGIVTALAGQDQGKLTVSGGHDGMIRVWDSTTGQLINVLDSPASPTTAVAISGDGKWVAAGDRAGLLCAWNLAVRGDPQQVVAHRGAVTAIRFDSSDGSLVTGGEDGQVRRWRLPLAAARQLPSTPLASAAFALSRDRRFVASINAQNQVQVHRIEDGSPRKQFDPAPQPLTAVAFAADLRTVVTGSRTGEIEIWDAATGKRTGGWHLHTGAVRRIVAHPQQPLFASAGADGRASVWKLPHAAEVLADLQNRIQVTALRPDRQRLALGLVDGSVHLWNLATGAKVALPPSPHPVTALRFSSDGRWLVVGSQNGQVRLWEYDAAARGAPLTMSGPEQPVTDVLYLPQSQFLWTTDASGLVTIRKWPHVESRTLIKHAGRARAIAVSPDGSLIASVGDDRVLRTVAWNQGQPRLQSTRLDAVATHIAIAPGNHRVWTLLTDGRLQSWQPDPAGGVLADARTIGTVPAEEVRGLACRGDGGAVALILANGELRWWQLNQDPPVSQQVVAHQGPVRALASAPSSDRFWTCGADNRLREWDGQGNATREIPLTDDANKSGLVGEYLAINSDGSQIAVSGADHVVRVFATTGSSTPILIQQPDPATGLMFSSTDALFVAGATQIRGFDVVRKKRLAVFTSPSAQVVAAARWGTATAFVAGLEDGTIVAWESAQVAEFHPHATPSAALLPISQERIATAGAEGVRIWNASGRRERDLVNSQAAQQLCATPDGKHLAGLIADGKQVAVWDVESGNPVHTSDWASGAILAGIAPDAKTVLVADADQARQWDVTRGTVVGEIKLPETCAQLFDLGGGELLGVAEVGRVHAVSLPFSRTFEPGIGELADLDFIPNGDGLLLGGRAGQLEIWNWTHEERLRSLAGISGELRTIAVSADGQVVLAAGSAGQVARWQTATGEPLPAIRTNGPVAALAISPEKAHVATRGDDGTVRIWTADSGTAAGTTGGSKPGSSQLVFLDARSILSAVRGDGGLEVLPLAGNWSVQAHPRRLVALDLLDDGRYMATAGGDAKVRLWDAVGAPLHDFDLREGVKAVAVRLSRDGVVLFAAGNDDAGKGWLYAWSRDDRRRLIEVELPAAAKGLATTRDGSWAAVLGADGQVGVYDRATGQLLQQLAVGGGGEVLATVHGASLLLVGFQNGSLRLVPVNIAQAFQAHTSTVVGLSFLDDMHLVSAGVDGEILGWNLSQPIVVPANTNGGSPSTSDPSRANAHFRFIGKAGVPAKCLNVAHGGDVVHVSALFANVESTAAVWAFRPGTSQADIPAVTMLDQPSPADSVLSTGNGRLLLTGAADVVRVWNVATRTEIARFKGHAASLLDLGRNDVTNTLVGGTLDGAVRIWSLPTNLNAAPAAGAEVAAADADRKFTLDKLEAAPELVVDSTESMGDSAELVNASPDQRIQVLEDRLRSAGDDQARAAARAELLMVRQEQAITQNLSGARTEQERQDAREQLSQLKQLQTAGKSLLDRFTALRERISQAGNDTERQALRKSLVEEQQRHFQQMTALAAATQARSHVVFDAGHPHQLATIQTAYSFGANDQRGVEGIRLLISADMSLVIAARAGGSADGQAPDGTVEVWDTFSGEKLRQWKGPAAGSLSELLFAPDRQSIVTYPALHTYHIGSGFSRFVASDVKLARYLGEYAGDDGLLAVGLSGAAQQQADVLQFFSGSPLAELPTAFRAFEAKTTAVAFAHHRPKVAFAVRERAGHRLMVADADLSLSAIATVEQMRHSRPWVRTEQNDEMPALGVLSLAFSRDDRLLVVNGNYEDPADARKQYHSVTIWEANWKDSSFKKIFETPHQEAELFLNRGSQPIQFVGNSLVVAVPTPSGLGLVDLGGKRSQVVGEITLPATQRGRAETCFSDDGRWLAAGDDQGNVTLWNLETQGKRLLTDNNRPAHSGPVLGVTFSPTHHQTGSIDYLATAGEENQIKIWSLSDLLDRRKFQSEPRPRFRNSPQARVP